MIRPIISLYDTKAEQYMPPYSPVTLAVAMREIASEIINNTQSPLHTFTSDFELWQLGTIDLETGFIEADKPTKICEIKTLVDTGDENVQK